MCAFARVRHAAAAETRSCGGNIILSLGRREAFPGAEQATSTPVVSPEPNERKTTNMARKPASKPEFVLFDVTYEDGSQRSNRRVPQDILGGLDGDKPARVAIEAQDKEIAERSGRPMAPIKTLRRSH